VAMVEALSPAVEWCHGTALERQECPVPVHDPAYRRRRDDGGAHRWCAATMAPRPRRTAWSRRGGKSGTNSLIFAGGCRPGARPSSLANRRAPAVLGAPILDDRDARALLTVLARCCGTRARAHRRVISCWSHRLFTLALSATCRPAACLLVRLLVVALLGWWLRPAARCRTLDVVVGGLWFFRVGVAVSAKLVTVWPDSLRVYANERRAVRGLCLRRHALVRHDTSIAGVVRVRIWFRSAAEQAQTACPADANPSTTRPLDFQVDCSEPAARDSSAAQWLHARHHRYRSSLGLRNVTTAHIGADLGSTTTQSPIARVSCFKGFHSRAFIHSSIHSALRLSHDCTTADSHQTNL